MLFSCKGPPLWVGWQRIIWFPPVAIQSLSCGRGTSPAPPYKESTAKDAIIPAFKVGPGFSKILNFLQTVATPEDLRRSDGEAPESRRPLQTRSKLVLPKVSSLKPQRSSKDFKSS